MKKYLTRIAPLRAATVLGVIHAGFGLIALAFFLLGTIYTATSGNSSMGVGHAILFSLCWPVYGFIGGFVFALFYNQVAKWTGGLEFEVNETSAT